MSADIVNPAIVIGLGGTGKWVLTYIKKNLLDTYGGVMPKTVRLLSFDTTSEKVSRDGVAQEEDARVGDVQLDKQAEFVYLGGNIQEICREIRDSGAHAHIRPWLQARTYLQTADSDAFDISRGAGQKRPFGRMAIFYDLQQAVQSRIINKLETAIGQVIDANHHQAPIEIYIVASLAGGTGAGMFIDIAHIARWFANRQVRTGFAIRGFLALHNTFRSVIKTEQIQPQAFAALRELDRFMLVFDQQYPIVYNPSNPILQTIYGGKLGKLFDNCYLLDASRDNLPLDGYEPKYGVYPSIADSITMLLDPSTGDAYAQHYKNVNTRIADVQSKIKQPIYSSLGSYSLVLPVEDMIGSMAYRFAGELLAEHLLNCDERVNEAGQPEYLLRYDGDARKEAASMLAAPRSGSGVISTNFIQRLAPLVEHWRAHSEAGVGEFIGLDATDLLAWILPPETDPALEDAMRRVRKALNVALPDLVQPSSVVGDGTLDGSERIQSGVRDFRVENLGREVEGRPQGGLYREALEQCVEIHCERYRMLLREHVIALLNGPDPRNKEYQREKRGRLAQAREQLAQLARYFADFSALMHGVKERRVGQDELRGLQEEAMRCRLDMESKKGKRGALGLFVKQLQPAVQAQRAYIESEARVIDEEIKDLCLDYLQQAADLLRGVTEEHRAAVDSWIATLQQGVAGAFSDAGLAKYLRRSAALYAANREEKKRIAVHEYLTDEGYEAELYQSICAHKFDEALARLVWGAEPQRDSFRLTLSGLTIAEGSTPEGRTATARNADYLLAVARDYCAPVRDLSIADRLKHRDVLQLAGMLLEKCSPLLRYDPARSGGEQELRYFICVNEGHHKAFFNQFRDALKRIGASARDNQMLNSSNPYTCTVLATADVISSWGLLAYTAAEQEYNNYTGDARLLHIFPAEVTAVQLEQELPRIREPRRRFSPTLTAMLEDRWSVELFILAYVYRFIRMEDAHGINGSRWVLHMPGADGLPEDRFALTPADRRPSICDALERFVFHRSDVGNPIHVIDYHALEQSLRAFEQRASGGNESRLINMLEAAAPASVELLRSSPEQAIQDIASLVQLVVNEIIQGLLDRIRAGGRFYDPAAQPLTQPLVVAAPQHAHANGSSNGALKQAAVGAVGLAEDDGERAHLRLRELKRLLDDGLIDQAEYDAKRREILSRL